MVAELIGSHLVNSLANQRGEGSRSGEVHLLGDVFVSTLRGMHVCEDGVDCEGVYMCIKDSQPQLLHTSTEY